MCWVTDRSDPQRPKYLCCKRLSSNERKQITNKQGGLSAVKDKKSGYERQGMRWVLRASPERASSESDI
jgi:hypothetical protein